MGRKGVRYFDKSHHRSTSPSIIRSGVKSSANLDNKTASEHLKNTIKSYIKNESSRGLNTTKTYVSLEDQVKLATSINEINNESFNPKKFVSNRSLTASVSPNDGLSVADIPLPKDANSWRDNPKLLIAPKLYIGTVESRKQKWKENLMRLRYELESKS